MSMALTHFAVGGTLTALVTLYLVPPTRYANTFPLLGGIWAMLPDIHWITPIYAPELKSLHSSVFMNIFWFHETLDVLDPSDSHTVAAVAVGVFVITTLVADRWAYTVTERATPAMQTDGPIESLRSVTRLSRIASAVAVVLGVSYLGTGVVHLWGNTLQPTYLGVGTALVAGGTLGLGAQITTAAWLTHQLPDTGREGFFVVSSVGTAVVGGTLLTAVGRAGFTAHAGVVAGLGALLGLFALFLARLRLE